MRLSVIMKVIILYVLESFPLFSPFALPIPSHSYHEVISIVSLFTPKSLDLHLALECGC